MQGQCTEVVDFEVRTSSQRLDGWDEDGRRNQLGQPQHVTCQISYALQQKGFRVFCGELCSITSVTLMYGVFALGRITANKLTYSDPLAYFGNASGFLDAFPKASGTQGQSSRY
jgi:hypothetical protein